MLAFGPFTFDAASRLLWNGGAEVSLPPRVLGVLALLLERRGELVTKQELIGAVWRDAFVTETSLAEAVSVLRQTLGDDPQQPVYIQTLHRRGYRFIADVRDPSMAPAARDAVAGEAPDQAGEREPRLSLLVPWTVTLFALLTAGTAVWRYLDRVAPPDGRPIRFALALPAGLTLARTGSPIAVSDDGSLAALAACRAGAAAGDDDCGIYLRPLSQLEPTLVAGTSGGAAPFFSPDGRSLGFFAGGRLYTIALAGGSPVAIADASEALGAAWLRDGRIVFARSSSEGLFGVGPRGRPPVPLTTPSPGEGGHRWPAALPDGSAVVFTVGGTAARPDRHYAGIASLRTPGWGRLLDDVTAVRVPVTGYLLAQRGAGLLASAFDDRAHTVAGLPVAIAPLESPNPVPQFAMSASGTLMSGAPGAASLDVVVDWAAELRRLVPAAPPAPPK